MCEWRKCDRIFRLRKKAEQQKDKIANKTANTTQNKLIHMTCLADDSIVPLNFLGQLQGGPEDH